MTTIADIIQHLERIAPPVYQEGYDNAGLIVGQASQTCTGVLTCLDATEAVVAEAREKGCNLIVAHHPIVFKGLKRLTGRNYVERVVIEAIRHEIAIYAIHTNLDNVYARGVNSAIAERLGLTNTHILAPQAALKQLSIYVSPGEADELKARLNEAAAAKQQPGTAVRLATIGAGEAGALVKLEVTFHRAQQGSVLRTLSAFGELDYQLHSLEQPSAQIGAGLVGELPEPLSESDFLAHLKSAMAVHCIRHTPLLDQPVQRVALCGGAGGFLLPQAIGSGAQFFITGDYKYHEFFDADGHLVIADIGHFESEQFTIPLLANILKEKFGNFAVHCTEVVTNPVRYYV
ncbi:MAG: Nif3-like dinuclear metal center hexameric protein [Lewinella sp.]|nr:Nif3-like dinuclear metal center hexameric protein [Lewinella sp.]